jgi:DNA-binding winged helix-turn-helix (wHTH) protein/Tol biopolymer transport system component
MNDGAKQPITFAEFELDAARRQLRRGGEIVPLKAKAFDVLLFLAENAGRIITKEEILSAVWKDSFVEEANLAVQISALQKALNDKKETPRFLVTVPGKGYEFIADIKPDEEIVIENLKFSRLAFEEEEEKRSGREEEQKPKISFSPLLFHSSSKIVIAILLVALTTAAILIWRGNGRQNSELKPPKITRLTTSGKVSAVALAPDGRFAVFSQKETDGESLWLRQIETGSQTRIAPSRNLEYLGLTVSPDGNHIYASVYLENQADTPLWKIPILGGAAEEIPNVLTSAAISFSPDGKRIAYTESRRPETHLVVADANGANSQILIRAHNDQRRFPFEQAKPTAWSPDGETLAVVFEEKSANGSQAGVLLVNPADGAERILVAPRWAFIDFVAWLDAETLAFTGYDDEWSNQIYTISRRMGETRQITNNLQKYRWLATGGGNLLTAETSAVSNIYVADFTETAETLSPREVLRESGDVFYIGWSKSGAIFYSSRITGKSEIWLTENDGSSPSQVPSGANIVYGLAISPTDGSLVFPAKQNGKIELYTADADGRNLRRVFDGAEPIYPEIAPDGTIVFQDGDYKIARLAQGEKTPVQLAKGLKPALSPDGQQTAFFLMDEGKWRIRIAATATGEIIKNLDLPTNVRERRMRWHPSGKFLGLIYHAGEKLSLLLLPTDGGKPRIIENLGKGVINTFVWSADGKQILYSVTNETQDAVWLSDF